MQKASKIHPDLVGLTRWLFSLSIILCLFNPAFSTQPDFHHADANQAETISDPLVSAGASAAPDAADGNRLSLSYAAQVDTEFGLIPWHVQVSYLQQDFPEQLEFPPDNSSYTTAVIEKTAEQDFLHIIHHAAERYQVDAALVKAVIKAESGYNPRAESKKGAKGLMQLMPKTARSLGVEDLFDPEHNIDGGVRYLKRLIDQFNGDVKLALAAYNAGSRYVRKYRGVPPFKETRAYVAKVFKYLQHYKTMVESG